MNKDQTLSHLVEVKYKQSWNSLLIDDLREQVQFFNYIILVCINGEPVTEKKDISGSTHLRAIELKFENEKYQARKYRSSGEGLVGTFEWVEIDGRAKLDWWELAPMQFVFTEMTSWDRAPEHPKYGKNVNTLLACRAIGSLMDSKIWELDE